MLIKRLSLLVLFGVLWTLMPWQLFCLDHNHAPQNTSAYTHKEAVNTIHGCQIDFFAPFNHASKSPFLAKPFFQIVVVQHGPSIYSTTDVLEAGRAPPEVA